MGRDSECMGGSLVVGEGKGVILLSGISRSGGVFGVDVVLKVNHM